MNDQPEPTETAAQAAKAGFFIAPDGDLHLIKPIKGVWTNTHRVGLFRKRYYEVTLDYADGQSIAWSLQDRAKAESYRDQLKAIAIKHGAKTA